MDLGCKGIFESKTADLSKKFSPECIEGANVFI